MNKKWWECAGIRAIKTTAQTMVGLVPVGFKITPTMIQEMNWNMTDIVLAWLLTGLFSGFLSLLTSLGGLPEVNYDEPR